MGNLLIDETYDNAPTFDVEIRPGQPVVFRLLEQGKIPYIEHLSSGDIVNNDISLKFKNATVNSFNWNGSVLFRGPNPVIPCLAYANDQLAILEDIYHSKKSESFILFINDPTFPKTLQPKIRFEKWLDKIVTTLKGE